LEPKSLLEPAPPPASPPPPLPGPYFEQDPRLDPPDWAQPGWFADLDLSPTKAHFKNRLNGTVQINDFPPDAVHVGGADLDWTVSPRIEVGYRLPSGFGAFGFSYRFLITQGSALGLGPDGPAAFKSRLDVHILDLDYISREFSVWPLGDLWKMQFRIGQRWASIYYDANSLEAFDVAVAGSGIFSARNTDRYVGTGPHGGFELVRQLNQPGLSVFGRFDAGINLGRIRQGFFESSTTLGPNGLPFGGVNQVSSSQTVPVVNFQAGITYRPPTYPNVELFLGYQFEYWWNVGRFSLSANSRGELIDQGITLRVGYNY
jgi:hypothetical protein